MAARCRGDFARRAVAAVTTRISHAATLAFARKPTLSPPCTAGAYRSRQPIQQHRLRHFLARPGITTLPPRSSAFFFASRACCSWFRLAAQNAAFLQRPFLRYNAQARARVPHRPYGMFDCLPLSLMRASCRRKRTISRHNDRIIHARFMTATVRCCCAVPRNICLYLRLILPLDVEL